MRLLEEAGPAARRHQHGDRRTARGLRGRAGRPRPGRHPLHRLDAGRSSTCGSTVGENIARYRSYPRHRRRDRRQGLHRRPPERRPRRAADRDGPRRLRVPGPEVLGRLARLRAAQPLGRGCATTSRRRPTSLTMGDVTDLSQLHGRGHRRPRVRQAQGGARAGARPTTRSPSSPAAPTTTARATSSGRPCSSRTDPTNEIFTTEYFGPILGVHVYDDADYDAMLDPDGVGGAVRADRLDHRPGPGGDRRRRSE